MKEKKVPMRRCIGCMQSKPKKELVRIVDTEEGLRIDLSGKLNGRGCYICRDEACLALAIKKNAIPRNLKSEISRDEANALAEDFRSILNTDL